MQKHKILEDLGFKRKDLPYNFGHKGDFFRQLKWYKERKRYGFDDREVWDLHVTFVYWLLERLIMYRDIAGANIDLTFHTFDYYGNKINQSEALELMIDYCVKFLDKTSSIEDCYNIWEQLAELWYLTGPAFWY